MSDFHIPVMPQEVIKYLDVKPSEWYLDCNLGGGGHTELILKMGGKVIGLDMDPAAIAYVTLKYNLNLHKTSNRVFFVNQDLIICQANFSKLNEVLNSLVPILPELQNDIHISGVLFDLGVSSYQLETAERGFSFNLPAKLDMRMDKSSQSATAADLINGLHEGELAQLFFKLGEESFARVIAKKITQMRQYGKIERTNELANIILSVKKRGRGDTTHPATKVFQALRIAVNDELNSLKIALPQALKILKPDGRLVVISFHSLEDRIVKDFMKKMEKSGKISLLINKPIEPSEKEVYENPRSHSGKLRAAEKL